MGLALAPTVTCWVHYVLHTMTYMHVYVELMVSNYHYHLHSNSRQLNTKHEPAQTRLSKSRLQLDYKAVECYCLPVRVRLLSITKCFWIIR